MMILQFVGKAIEVRNGGPLTFKKFINIRAEDGKPTGEIAAVPKTCNVLNVLPDEAGDEARIFKSLPIGGVENT